MANCLLRIHQAFPDELVAEALEADEYHVEAIWALAFEDFLVQAFPGDP